MSAVTVAAPHADDVLRITPITLGDLSAIRRSLNSALAFLERQQLTHAQSEAFTNLADATDLLDLLEEIPGMQYAASNARDRLLRLYKLSASLDAARPSITASVRL